MFLTPDAEQLTPAHSYSSVTRCAYEYLSTATCLLEYSAAYVMAPVLAPNLYTGTVWHLEALTGVRITH